MNRLGLLVVAVLAACGSKDKGKDKDTGSTTPPAGSSTATGSATGSAAATAGSGAGSSAGSDAGSAGSGSDVAAGSGSGSGSGSAAPDDGITFDKLPDTWQASGGQLDTYEAVNESKFPVDNASFIFEYGLDAADMPADPKAYAAVLDKAGMKVIKFEKTPNGHYFESDDAFRYVIVAGDRRIHCGGSLYKNDDYDKIPKIRDRVVGEAKRICQTARR